MRKLIISIVFNELFLLLVGILIVIRQVQGIPLFELLMDWWFVILGVIIVNVSIYINTPKASEVKGKVSRFCVFIFILIVIFEISAYIPKVTTNFISISKIASVFSGFKNQLKFEKQISIPIEGKTDFAINNISGDVEIIGTNGKSIDIFAKIFIQCDDKEAVKLLSDSIIEISKDNMITISTKSFSNEELRNIKDIKIDYLINVPKDITVSVKNNQGDIKVQETIGSVTLYNKEGNIYAKAIEGNLTVSNSYGIVSVENVKGKIQIVNLKGEVAVKNVDSELKVKNIYGDINVNSIKGNTELISDNSKTKTKNIAGDLKIEQKCGSIEASVISGNANISTTLGRIYLENIEGNVTASNKDANIQLINANKNITLTSDKGNIIFKTDKIIESGLNVTNINGQVDITIPKNQSGHFKLDVFHGSITNNLKLNIFKDANSQKQYFNDTIGDGKTNISVSSSDGNVVIKGI
jgi:hypothetical protein